MPGFGFGFGPVFSGGWSRWPSPIEIGQIFTDTFDRLSLGSNYTTVGTPTVSVDGTDLILSNGTSTYTRYIKYTAWTTCLEKWRIVINFEADTQAAASEGIYIGIKTASAFGNRSVICQFAHGTGPSKGKSYILAGTTAPENYSAALQTSAAQAVMSGDEIRMTITRNGLDLTCFTENITGGTSTTITHSFSLDEASAVFMHNTGNPIIGTLGGTQKIHDWTFTSTAKKNIYALFVGDSITHGVSATTETDRWVNKLMNGSNHVYEINSGGGDYTAPALVKIQEILLHNPQYLVLMLGGNDIRFSIAAGTWQANYASIVLQAQAAGITVIHCAAPPDDATNVKPHLTWLQGQYSGVIDTFNPLTTTPNTSTDLAVTYDSGDGTHPNDAGHALLASTIDAATTVLP